MLLTIQFPIADSRQFLEERTGFLNFPAWAHSVDPTRDFVRSFGKIEKRRLGGLQNWIGESSICFARRALRFPDNALFNFAYAADQIPIPLGVVFRRFFSDGIATGKFEVGIGTRSKTPINFTSTQTKEFINYFLKLKVQIPYCSESVPLADAGKCISNLYLKASTKRKELKIIEPQSWWVEPGKPILFLVYSEAENIKLPFHIIYIKKLDLKTDAYELGFCKIPWKNGIEIGMWFVKVRSDINYKSIRALRIALLRLYAERQCVRIILRNIGKNRIIINPKTILDELNAGDSERNKISDKFQSYWKTVVGRIGSYRRLANTVVELLPDEDEISETARLAEDIIEPGERQEILNGLEHIRPNYLRTIQEFTYNDIKNYAEVKEQNMTKNEHIEKNVEQEIKIGDNAAIGAIAKEHAEMHGNIVKQSIGGEIDLKALLVDLTKLREELDRRKTTTEDYIAIGKVAEAQAEAEKGNSPKVWEILKNTGKWVFDTATDIGAKVAVEAIKKSVGI
jgi:hypothetical protein